MERVARGQDRWERLEKGTFLDSQLLEAAWLLSVPCQQGTAELPALAPGQRERCRGAPFVPNPSAEAA